MANFREILDAEQLKVYEANLRAGIQRFEASLAEQDKERHTDIAFHEASIHFYETQLLPELRKPVVPMFVGLRQDASNVD